MFTLLKRAHRVLAVAVAFIFVATLFAPMAALASTDLVAGDQAEVSNPNGTGANLRSDTAVLDESTLITELPQGAVLTVIDGPFYNDTGVWVYVNASGFEGYVDTTLLTKITPEVAATTEEAAPESPAVVVAWAEPIDRGTVVDNNVELPADGLAVRVAPEAEAEVIGRVPVGTELDVTEQRLWINGSENYVRVNFQGAGGYVNGKFLILNSEAIVEEPVETEVATEEVVAPVETEVVTEEAVAPVETEVVTEEVVAPVETEVVTEEVVAPVETEVVTEEVVAPVETEVITEEVVAPAETEVITEEVVTQAVTEEIVDESAPVETAEVVTAESTPVETDEAIVDESTPVETEDVIVDVSTPVETEDVIVDESTPVATDEVVTEESTPVETEDAIVDESTPVGTDEVVTEESTPATIASTVDTFDADAMIGSATVTGTTSGLICRTAPDASAPVIMVLAEGTKVLVSAEAVNGYLGIDCGGLQGFADVNYLWSGGAGDGEITQSNMTVVVTGTGNGLNCRTGAGTGFPVITVLRDGNALTTRGAASGGWTPVTCGGRDGFVFTEYVSVSSVAPGGSTGSTGSTTSGTATVVNTGGDSLYCRSGAGTSYSIITTLAPGQSVPVRGGNQGGWVPVTCGGRDGFASAQFLSVTAGSAPTNPTPAPTNPTPAPSNPAPTTGQVTVANTGGVGLNCRSGAGTSFGVITTLALGQTVSTRAGSVSGWTAVVCGGRDGFVSSQYVTGSGSTPTNPAPTPAPAPQPSGMVNGDHAQTMATLNIRYSASLGAGVSTAAPEGTVVLITGNLTNGFYPINWDGLTGFMHSDYLTKTTAPLSKRGGSATPSEPAPTNPGGGTATGSAMVEYAMRYVGYPYVWATHGPSSFDCSGFTYWVTYNVTGKNIGYGTWTQVAAGTPVSRANLQPGDLVFFQNTYTAGLSHVGLYIGGGQFVHAQNESTGVVVSSLDSSYYGPRWYGAVRVA